MDNPNCHIEEFLDYYYAFDKEPGYAVLLKGKWGTGKTWFIENSLKKLSESGKKHLYVSLYGISNFEEIENEFFKQLHPRLSSKSMALTAKIAKGLLKATLKIDLDDDGINDGSFSPQIPDINLPDYLLDTCERVIVFDDLERTSIDIEKILGYINHFVEHQGYKVIIIANEDEILEKQENNKKFDIAYKRIKEKLIGKTFQVIPNFSGSLDSFISEINSIEIKKLLIKNTEVILSLYELSEYRNLRSLKQSIWDFERISSHISQEAKQKEGLLDNLLRIFLILSFEIKSGNIQPRDIKGFRSGYYSSINGEKNGPYQKISKKYGISIYDFLLEESLWFDLFDNGSLSDIAINAALEKSKYFKSENTPKWIRLWHSMNLSDDEFSDCLESVINDFKSMKFVELGEVKHITGILLWLAHVKMSSMNKSEVLNEAIKYIDYLKSKKSLVDLSRPHRKCFDNESWGGLGFHGQNISEFIKLSKYIDKNIEIAATENYPILAEDLLKIMESDPGLFYRKINLTNHADNEFYNIPIFKYIDENSFVDSFIRMNAESKTIIARAFVDRYKSNNFNGLLEPELLWIKSVVKILKKQIKMRKGKISGYQLSAIIDQSFKEAIKTLEQYSNIGNKSIKKIKVDPKFSSSSK